MCERSYTTDIIPSLYSRDYGTDYGEEHYIDTTSIKPISHLIAKCALLWAHQASRLQVCREHWNLTT